RDKQHSLTITEICANDHTNRLAIVSLAQTGQAVMEVIIMINTSGKWVDSRDTEIKFVRVEAAGRWHEAMKRPAYTGSAIVPGETKRIVEEGGEGREVKLSFCPGLLCAINKGPARITQCKWQRLQERIPWYVLIYFKFAWFVGIALISVSLREEIVE